MTTARADAPPEQGMAARVTQPVLILTSLPRRTVEDVFRAAPPRSRRSDASLPLAVRLPAPPHSTVLG